jgi:hypothetical protein
MTRSPLSEKQRLALRELKELAAARAQAEVDTESGFRSRNEVAEQEYEEAQRRIGSLHESARSAAEREVEESRQRISQEYDQDRALIAQDLSSAQARSRHIYATTKEKEETDFKESRWTITTVYDADKKVAKEQRLKSESRTEAAISRIAHLRQEARELLGRWRLTDLAPVPVDAPVEGEEDPINALQQCTVVAGTRVAELKKRKLPGFMRKFPWLWAGVWLLATAPAFLLQREWWYYWIAGSTVLGLGLGFGLRAWLSARSRTRVHELLLGLYQAQNDAERLKPRCLRMAKVTYRGQRAESRKRNQDALRQAIRSCRRVLRDALKRRDNDLQTAQENYARRLEEITRRRRLALEDAEQTYRRQLDDCESMRDAELQEARAKFERLREENNRRHAQEWTRLASTWKQGLDKFQALVRDIDAECRRLFPAWNHPCWENWQPAGAIPQGIRFGELDFSVAQIPSGVPEDKHLPQLQLGDCRFPALLPFPQRASMMLRARDEARAQAVNALQALLFRFLTALPPGKVRFTILDPVGRGENFAAFMHLADFDELLVSSRIWTETTHIEQRLADLTAHMENVIQKYLRNQYKTLEEYNTQAGEVAEPFRVLAVANFPVNFTPESARRLVSLASSGARCGIYTIVSVDTRQDMPQGFDLADLEQVSLVLDWQDTRFIWKDPDYPFPLATEHTPSPELGTRLLQMIGQQAKLAGRVEVPFDYVAPPPEQWWTGDSRQGISVALGRSGATGRQHLSLGHGTAQHALVGGKTGSGKSTLLHALITQVAQRYSPEEVELYLIDFKKGVEFKTYASHELPHARVVAVESEREFGLSVLQRLDAELKHRGERFRESAVNDLSSYRQAGTAQANGNHSMPRVLLVIDEFQEFFVEDDKIAQESALLLDRLVRQGRAFGVHVLLGSQTLGGAYSLARSTIDQMAVRIALQCSEADGHLILNKDNSAARLLSRPGEAIYNAAGGLLEGNSIFQVVWLSDERRDQVLQRVSALAGQRHFVPPSPQIVFEGTAPSDLRKNALLERQLANYPPAATPAVLQAWFGEAIAIKDPTAAVFRRQSGANVLMVGQQGEAAFQMLISSVLSLAAQLAPRETAEGTPAALSVVVGSPLDPAGEAILPRLPDMLAPHLQVISVRELPALIDSLAEEVNRRLNSAVGGEPLFLFLHGLHRLRDLRKGEDDFGFSRRGEEKASPAKQFLAIIRDGPLAGIFTIAWCDNLNNLNRTLDRQALREFEMRVLGQMSATDSSNLIDSPLAAKLGMNRALFSTEDQGRLEKFRPYGLPDAEWLDAIKAQLARRAEVKVGS